MTKTRRRKGARSDRAGAVLVEFAFVIPIILVLFLFAIEVTNLNMIRHTAANAAYEGARQAIVAGGTEDDARDEVLRLLDIVGISTAAVVDVDQWPDRVRVTVSIPVHLNSWGISRLVPGTAITHGCTLQREVVDFSLQ